MAKYSLELGVEGI